MTRNDGEIATSTNQDDEISQSSSESYFADIGFMFDGEIATKTQRLQFFPTISTDAKPDKTFVMDAASCTVQSLDTALKQSSNDNIDGNKREKYGSDETLQENNDKKSIHCITVELECVDDVPGAVQSGHYLWPGAPGLAQFLTDVFSSQKKFLQNSMYKTLFSHFITPLSSLPDPSLSMGNPPSLISDNDDNKKQMFSIIELGAGCGVAGLTAMQLPMFKNRIKSLVFTDHDPGTLERARVNHAKTLQYLNSKLDFTMDSKATNEINEEPRVFDKNKNYVYSTTIPVFFESLSWGDMNGVSSLLSKVWNEVENYNQTNLDNSKDDNICTSPHFDLILGSDLIYCQEIVKPLLTSAAGLMSATTSIQTKNSKCENISLIQSGPVMIMSQSFSYEMETEQAINEACAELSLKRTIISCDLDKGGVRIQAFQISIVELSIP